jgi:tetratricopeptide (TPR) repeat protein
MSASKQGWTAVICCCAALAYLAALGSCSGGGEEIADNAWTDDRARVDDEIVSLLDGGRYERAFALSDSVISSGASDARVLGQKARALGGLERFDESIPLFEEAIIMDYENCDNHINFAVVLMNNMKVGRAITEFRIAKEFCPAMLLPVIHRNLAVANIKLGREKHALDEVGEGLIYDPDDPYLLGLRAMLIAETAPSLAESLFVKSVSEGGASPDFLYQYGLLLLNSGRPTEAAQVLSQAAELKPGNTELEIALFESLNRSGRSGEAEELLAKLLEENPNDELRTKLARFLFKQERFDEALAVYEQLPRTAYHMDRMAMCHHALGNLDAAYAWEEKALDAQPDWTVGMINMAVILAARGELEEAAAYLERVLELEPENTTASMNLEKLREAIDGAGR